MPRYTTAIDWDRSRTFAGPGADVTDRTLADGIACERGRDQARALAPPMAGQGRFALDNRSRDYAPGNPASPLAGLLYPGCLVRGAATHLGVTYPLWTGILDDLPQRPALGERRVDIPWLGTLARLRGVTVSTALYEGISTDRALAVVLDAAGWPTADRVLSAGRTIFPYWWCEAADAYEMVATIALSEGPGAALYEDARGRLVFEDRYYRLDAARAVTAQATFRDAGAGPWHVAPFAYEPGLKDVINVASLDVIRRARGPLGVVWQADGAFALGPGETLRLDAVASGGDPFVEAVAPVAGVDYTVTGGTVAGVTLGRTSGGSAPLALTAGPTGASVAGLQLRARTLVGTKLRATSTIDAAASVARYGRRDWTAAIWPELDLNVAIDHCNVIVGLYREPRPTVTITVAAQDAASGTAVLAREISDRVRVVEAQTGLDNDLYIERIAHAIDAGSGAHLATFGLSPADATPQYLRLDSGTLGTGVLGF